MTALEYRSPLTEPGRDGFGQTVRSEWTKFRTVRGWIIALIIAALLPAVIELISHSECGSAYMKNGQVIQVNGCPSPPTGPGGEAVEDNFNFVHQPLTGNGSLTVRITSLTGLYATNGNAAANGSGTAGMQPGLEPWSKAGIMIKANTSQGSPYAAVMMTGSHGVRLQYNYTHDITGGAFSPSHPAWLRLTRTGNTITGYDSADSVHWTSIGTVTLTGLPSTVQIGMFAASPGHVAKSSSGITGSSSVGGPSQATAIFDRLSLSGAGTGGSWTRTGVGGADALDGFTQAGGTSTVSGTGDIAPFVGDASPGGEAGTSIEKTLTGDFVGLIALIVLAAMFMTSEYRRGLIRVTFAASPRRGRVLAAKAVVIAAVTFVAALIGTVITMIVGVHMLKSGGNAILPVSTFTLVRIVAGTAALFAVAAVLIVAIGALLRQTAAAVTIGIVTFVLVYLLTISVLPVGTADWVLRLTPAAAFAIQQSTPQYPQINGNYTPANGFYPLVPWAGFAVLCLYAAVLLGLAVYRVNRKDA
jgi:ABC-type transport system involved in multi-copper enzyme maturation permease subunit